MTYLIALMVALSQVPACPVETLSVDSGVIGWDRLQLGMSGREVTQVLGHSLELQPSETNGAISHATAELKGVRLLLAFRDADDSLVGLTLIRSEGESDLCWLRATLVSRVKSLFPRATYRPSRHDPDLSERLNSMPTYSVDGEGTVVLA